ncbi:MAG: MBL fold metallo-hydrolase [Pirellulales bacterium]
MSKDLPSLDISRRRFIATAGVAATVACLPARRLWAAPAGIVQWMRAEGATEKIKVQKLRNNISVVTGAGGNITVLDGTDGKLLVDGGVATAQKHLAEALADISSQPIKHLINTHWHFDHTDGNEWLHKSGAAIAAHRNTVKCLSKSTRVDDWDFTFSPFPADAIPSVIIPDEKSMEVNRSKIDLKYYGPAHTDGDIRVHFSDADVMHVADTWWNGQYPFIDYSTGGNIDGMILATEANLALASNKTIIIPGHGPVGDKSALKEFRDMLMALRDKIAALKTQRMTTDQVVAAKPTAEYDAKWGKSAINGDFFARLVYKGV